MDWKQFFRDWFQYMTTGEFRINGVVSNLGVYRINIYTLDGERLYSLWFGVESDTMTKDYVISSIVESSPELKTSIDFVVVEETRGDNEVMRIDGREIATWKAGN